MSDSEIPLLSFFVRLNCFRQFYPFFRHDRTFLSALTFLNLCNLQGNNGPPMVVARPVISHHAAPPSRPDPVPIPHQGSAESKRPGGPTQAAPKTASTAPARKASGPSVAAGRKYSDRSDGGEEKQMVSAYVP